MENLLIDSNVLSEKSEDTIKAEFGIDHEVQEDNNIQAFNTLKKESASIRNEIFLPKSNDSS